MGLTLDQTYLGTPRGGWQRSGGLEALRLLNIGDHCRVSPVEVYAEGDSIS